MRRNLKTERPDGLPKSFIRSRLVQNAFALMISSGGSGLLGLAFWGIAAHLATQTAVGRTSAEISAMILLANLSQGSFGTIFERFLPVAGLETKRFVVRGYVMGTILAFILATIYVFSGLAHSYLPTAFAWRAFFIVAVVMWTIFALQDCVLIGLRASKWVPVENISFAAMKLALLAALVSSLPQEGIFVAWVTPVILTIIFVGWYIFGKRIPEHMKVRVSLETLPRTRELVLLAAAQYATLLFSVIIPAVVTLIVIQRLGAVANAHYYVPALITGSLSIFLLSVYRSFIVEATSEPHALRHHTNMVIATMSAVLIPSVVFGVIFAPLILRIFGTTYATHSTTLLRMLLLSLPMSAVSIFYGAFAWLDRRVWWMSLRDLISGVIYFAVLFAMIGRHGILAIGYASLVTSALQGVFFLPVAIRRYRHTSNYDNPLDQAQPSAT
jgi:O-antigen/teichoic acid export membrane protein